MKKIVIDPDLCIGCGACTAFCPAVFKLDVEARKAKVDQQPENIDDEEVQMAISNCPVSAIKITEDEQ
jgi:ferredoxin